MAKGSLDRENKLVKSRDFTPLIMIVVGMAGVLGAFAALVMINLRPIDYAWCVPLLAVSALLIFRGNHRLKKK